MMTYYDTSHELLAEDIRDIKTLLGALEGVGPEIPDKRAILALTRAMYHVLVYAIRIIEKDRRREKEHGHD